MNFVIGNGDIGILNEITCLSIPKDEQTKYSSLSIELTGPVRVLVHLRKLIAASVEGEVKPTVTNHVYNTALSSESDHGFVRDKLESIGIVPIPVKSGGEFARSFVIKVLNPKSQEIITGGGFTGAHDYLKKLETGCEIIKSNFLEAKLQGEDEKDCVCIMYFELEDVHHNAKDILQAIEYVNSTLSKIERFPKVAIALKISSLVQDWKILIPHADYIFFSASCGISDFLAFEEEIQGFNPKANAYFVFCQGALGVSAVATGLGVNCLSDKLSKDEIIDEDALVAGFMFQFLHVKNSGKKKPLQNILDAVVMDAKRKVIL